MATEILLTSERFVKDSTSLSDNLAGKFLIPAIREVQETRLRQIVGSALLAKLKAIVPDGVGAPGNEAYADLLDRAQWFLAYAAAAECCVKTSYKVSNFGVVKTTDENASVATESEVDKIKDYYIFKADAACMELQRWILDNAAAFPELGEGACAGIRANLRSAASSGLWLGGPRGKIIPGGGGCCR